MRLVSRVASSRRGPNSMRFLRSARREVPMYGPVAEPGAPPVNPALTRACCRTARAWSVRIRIVETNRFARIAGRGALEERGAAVADGIRTHVLGFDERHERFGNLQMAEHVEAVAVELRIDREKIFLAIVHAVAALEIARGCKADALTGLRHERTRTVEDVRAAVARAQRIPPQGAGARRRHGVVRDQERAGVGDRGEADVVEEQCGPEHRRCPTDRSRPPRKPPCCL